MTTPDPTGIVAQLRGHRKRLGLSQQTVADRMGHGARSIVCDLETGARQPVLPTLLTWVNALGLTLTPQPQRLRGGAVLLDAQRALRITV